MTHQLRTCDLPFLNRMQFKWRVNRDTRINAGAKLVLDVLVMHVNCKYEECFPGQALICDETAMTENTVRAAIYALRDAGWITWKKAANGGYVYRIMWEANPEIEAPGVVRQADTPSKSEGAEIDGAPSKSEGGDPQNLRANIRTENTKVLPPSTKVARKSPKPCPSADQQPPQEGTAEWYKVEVWNVVGIRFKERFYPTISMAAFKKRLGHEIKRLDNDLRKVRLAMLETLRAEPGLDAWEYFCGVARQQPKDSEPRMRGTI